jgi:two-component system CheB/CheR fusion protein
MERELSGLRVLVADDDADNAEMLAVLLTLRGAKVRKAANAYEALEVAASWTPEVMLLDIEMPYMDGCELACLLRRAPATASAHVFAVTGHTSAAHMERAYAAGFDAYIPKPINGNKVVALIAKVASTARREAP